MTIRGNPTESPAPAAAAQPGGTAPTGAPAVELIGVTRRYGDLVAVDDVSLQIETGEFLTLLGASGSGKTTTLSMIAGFAECDTGSVSVMGRDVTQVPAHKRDIGLVFQNYALFPHMTVAQNIAYPLKLRRVNKREAATRVDEALAMVRLEGLGKRYPKQLSGGQQQRVGLARALVYRPPVLLMDEPFGALDRKLRREMQLELRELHKELGITVLFVTHDQEEALTLSDRIGVMHNGKIVQLGPPQQIYDNPATHYVLDFVGDSNSLDATIDSVGAEQIVARTAGGLVVAAAPRVGVSAADKVRWVIRPERVRFGGEEAASGTSADGELIDTIFLGDSVKCTVRLASGELIEAKVAGPDAPPPGRVIVQWDAADASILDAATADLVPADLGDAE